MTPSAVAKLVAKWREYALKMRHGKDILVEPSSKELVDLQVEMAERFLADLTALATAPSEPRTICQICGEYSHDCKGHTGQPQPASAGALSADFEAHWEREIAEWAKRGIALSKGTAEVFWKLAIEEAARVIDQCNREGPYNAIHGASRIRSLAEEDELAKLEARGVKWIQSALASHDQKVRAEALEEAAQEVLKLEKWGPIVPELEHPFQDAANAIRSLAGAVEKP